MKKKFDYVLFDLDGTLVDSFRIHAIAIHTCILSYGYHVDMKVVEDNIGVSLEYILDKCQVKEEDIEPIVNSLNDFYDEAISLYPNLLTLREDTLQAILEINKAGIKAGVITNSKEWLLKKIVEMNNINHQFDILSGASNDLRDKRERCRDLLGTMCLENSLYVGDTLNDIRFAKEFNMHSCIIAHEIGWEPDYDLLIGDYNPEYVFRNFAEFTEYFLGGRDD